jgi:hypothetical protein
VSEARRPLSEIDFGSFCRRPRLLPAFVLLMFFGAVPVVIVVAMESIFPGQSGWLQDLAALFPSGRVAIFGTGVGLLGAAVALPLVAYGWLRRRFGHAQIRLDGIAFIPPDLDYYGPGGEPCGEECRSRGRKVVIPYDAAEWTLSSHGVQVRHRDTWEPIKTLFPFLIPVRGDEAKARVIHALEAQTTEGIAISVAELTQALAEGQDEPPGP